MKRKRVPLWAVISISIAPLAPLPGAVPLRIAGRHILVDRVYVNGAGPFRFVLDTGAESSSISPEAARRIGLKPAYRAEVESVRGTEWMAAGVVKAVTLEHQTAMEVEMVIHDMSRAREIDSAAEGVLGQNFLARFNYLLDIRGRRLSFDEDIEGQRIPFTRVADRMVVPSGALKLVLDSGTGRLVLFHQDHAPKLRLGGRTLKNVAAEVIPHAGGGPDALLPLTLFDEVYVSNTSGYVVVR